MSYSHHDSHLNFILDLKKGFIKTNIFTAEAVVIMKFAENNSKINVDVYSARLSGAHCLAFLVISCLIGWLEGKQNSDSFRQNPSSPLPPHSTPNVSSSSSCGYTLAGFAFTFLHRRLCSKTRWDSSATILGFIYLIWMLYLQMIYNFVVVHNAQNRMCRTVKSSLDWGFNGELLSGPKPWFQYYWAET